MACLDLILRGDPTAWKEDWKWMMEHIEEIQTLEVSSQLAEVEAQVDEAAAELWSITDRELKEIRRSLAELG